jgi:cell division initiation protein
LPLTPLEIQNKEFRRSLRGYHEQDVDEFLDEIVREHETIVRDSAGLKDQIARLEERLSQYTDIEDVLKRTLIKAEEAAGNLRADAQREADLIIREAKEQARGEIAAARRECAIALEDLARVKQEYRNFLSRVKGELRVQVEAIERLSTENHEQAPAHQPEQPAK